MGHSRNQHCNSCSFPDHEIHSYDNRPRPNPFKPLYDRFKPAQYRPKPYTPKPSILHNYESHNQSKSSSYSDSIQNRNNNQMNQTGKQNQTPPPTVTSAIKSMMEQLTSLENKFQLLEDELIKTQNACVKLKQIQLHTIN